VAAVGDEIGQVIGPKRTQREPLGDDLDHDAILAVLFPMR
jgi:hypothetical protein